MLSKKIKSLLVAGLLVFSMSGAAFAEGADLPKTSTSVIEYPKFEDGKRIVELQGGLIIAELTEKENGDISIKVKWHADNIKILGVKSYYENETDATDKGSIDHTNYFEELYHCNTLVKEGDFYTGRVLGGIAGKKLVKVEIAFENLTKGQRPVEPPVEPPVKPETPEEKVTDPETGDASIMPIVAVAAVSVAGLFVLRNKDDEE